MLPTTLFFKFCPHTPHPFTSKLHGYCYFFLLACFFCWMGNCHIWCVVLLNDIMDLHMLSLGTLFLGGSGCVCTHTHTRTHTHTHTHTHIHIHTHVHTDNTQGPVDWHTNIDIITSPVIRHSSYLHYIDRIIHWYQKFILNSVFAFQKFRTSRSHIYIDYIQYD